MQKPGGNRPLDPDAVAGGDGVAQAVERHGLAASVRSPQGRVQTMAASNLARASSSWARRPDRARARGRPAARVWARNWATVRGSRLAWACSASWARGQGAAAGGWGADGVFGLTAAGRQRARVSSRASRASRALPSSSSTRCAFFICPGAEDSGSGPSLPGRQIPGAPGGDRLLGCRGALGGPSSASHGAGLQQRRCGRSGQVVGSGSADWPSSRAPARRPSVPKLP